MGIPPRSALNLVNIREPNTASTPSSLNESSNSGKHSGAY